MGAAQASASDLFSGKEALVVCTGNPANWVLQPGANDGALDGVARLLFANAGGN